MIVEELEEAQLDLEEVKVLLKQLGLDRKLITEQSAICILALADGRERDGSLQGKKHLRDGARIHDITPIERSASCWAKHTCNRPSSPRRLYWPVVRQRWLGLKGAPYSRRIPLLNGQRNPISFCGMRRRCCENTAATDMSPF
ncbi:hypothetical protein C2W62_38830 [Candidatus Entotheonella serta]|nr:hypothetical protein C2W62_38830 [Candidatus Entotheonella serta]